MIGVNSNVLWMLSGNEGMIYTTAWDIEIGAAFRRHKDKGATYARFRYLLTAYEVYRLFGYVTDAEIKFSGSYWPKYFTHFKKWAIAEGMLTKGKNCNHLTPLAVTICEEFHSAVAARIAKYKQLVKQQYPEFIQHYERGDIEAMRELRKVVGEVRKKRAQHGAKVNLANILRNSPARIKEQFSVKDMAEDLTF